jgi:hypothetical protein
MLEKRVTLLESFRNEVEQFKDKKQLGRMDMEHVIFLPSVVLRDQEGETEEFVKAARKIRDTQAWNCPVQMEAKTEGRITGVELLFGFSPSTDFDAIIEELNNRLN